MKKFFERAISLIKSHKIVVISIAAAIVVAGVVLCIVLANTGRGNSGGPEPTDPAPTAPAPTSHTHSYTAEEVEATCGHGGRTLYTCECGHSYVENETPALEHEYGSWVTTLEATVEHEGQKERHCVHCNHRVTEAVPKLAPHEHKFKDKVTAATCTAAGSTLRTCTVCGYKTIVQGDPALDHTWGSWKETGKPDADGLVEISRTCKTCKKVETDKISKEPVAHEHTFTDTVVEPTCTEGGYTLRECDCGESYKTDETTKRGHLYGDWTTTKMPTTTETGEKQCVCSRCGDVKKETIAKLDEATAEKYEHYIDPRVEIKTVPTTGKVRYIYHPVEVTDGRAWGDPPTIRINDAGGFDITYYKQDGTKVSYILHPIEGYINRLTILNDGSYVTQLIGDYND